MRILVLSTYPRRQPDPWWPASAQPDCSNVRWEGPRSAFERRARVGVLPVSIGVPRVPPGRETLAKYIADPTLMEDWAIGRYAADPQGAYKKLGRLCDATYDLKCSANNRGSLVLHIAGFQVRNADQFSSTVRRILSSSSNFKSRNSISRVAAERAAELVAKTEQFAIANADMIVAVSNHDRDWLASAAHSTPVILASNGMILIRPSTLIDVEQSNALTKGRKFALYCAAAIPPNIQGFYDMFGNGVGCFAPADRLVAAGGAGPSIIAGRHRDFHAHLGWPLGLQSLAK